MARANAVSSLPRLPASNKRCAVGKYSLFLHEDFVHPGATRFEHRFRIQFAADGHPYRLAHRVIHLPKNCASRLSQFFRSFRMYRWLNFPYIKVSELLEIRRKHFNRVMGVQEVFRPIPRRPLPMNQEFLRQKNWLRWLPALSPISGTETRSRCLASWSTAI